MSQKELRDFRWLTGSAVGTIPDGLLKLPLKEIAERGDGLVKIPVVELSEAVTAVLWRVSPDKKMWLVDFYDVADPRPLLAAGKQGRFRIEFYHRDGRFNVFKIHGRTSDEW